MNPRRLAAVLTLITAESILFGACVKKEMKPAPTKTGYYGTISNHKGTPVAGVKIVIYGQYHPGGPQSGSGSLAVAIDSVVSNDSGQFSNTFVDPGDLDRYSYSTFGLSENLSGPLEQGQSNRLALETWRFYTLVYRLHILNNSNPPLFLNSSLYGIEVLVPQFDTTIITQLKWNTGNGMVVGGHGNEAYYMLNGERHSSYIPEFYYSIDGSEISDTVVKDCTLDCGRF